MMITPINPSYFQPIGDLELLVDCFIHVPTEISVPNQFNHFYYGSYRNNTGQLMATDYVFAMELEDCL